MEAVRQMTSDDAMSDEEDEQSAQKKAKLDPRVHTDHQPDSFDLQNSSRATDNDSQ